MSNFVFITGCIVLYSAISGGTLSTAAHAFLISIGIIGDIWSLIWRRV